MPETTAEKTGRIRYVHIGEEGKKGGATIAYDRRDRTFAFALCNELDPYSVSDACKRTKGRLRSDVAAGRVGRFAKRLKCGTKIADPTDDAILGAAGPFLMAAANAVGNKRVVKLVGSWATRRHRAAEQPASVAVVDEPKTKKEKKGKKSKKKDKKDKK